MENAIDSIIERIFKKNRVKRILLLLVGSFIFALFYNAYVAPNKLVYGGVGGFAIVINKLFHISNTITIDVLTVALIIISSILLGYKKTISTIIGFGSYALMINLTEPLVKYFSFTLDSFFVSVILYAIIGGFGIGLIYRAGFNTGGVDSLVLISQKYLHMPTATLSVIINTIIIIMGIINFGVEKSIYAIVLLVVMNFVSNRIMIGISNSKLCLIESRELEKIEEYLKNEMNVGYTLLYSTNGVGLIHKPVILCVLSTETYYMIKNKLKIIDKRHKLISNDCYTVEGGTRNNLLQF